MTARPVQDPIKKRREMKSRLNAAKGQLPIWSVISLILAFSFVSFVAGSFVGYRAGPRHSDNRPQSRLDQETAKDLAGQDPVGNNQVSQAASVQEQPGGTRSTVLSIVPKSQFVFYVLVRKGIAKPSEISDIATSICLQRTGATKPCLVSIWEDVSKMGLSYPMTLEQANAVIFSYQSGEPLWSCERFPQMGEDDCFNPS